MMLSLKQLLSSTRFELSRNQEKPEAYEKLFCRIEDPWNFRRPPYERGRLNRLYGIAKDLEPRSGLEVGGAV